MATISDKGEKLAEVSGKFRFQTTILSDYPAVGDFVLVNWNESGNSAIIESLLPRKSAFVRKAAEEPQQEQVVAANIDIVFLCMALNNDFNLRRLERYISIGWDSGAMPVIVLTKSDLCDDLEQKLSEVSSVAFGVNILVTTSTEENGYKELVSFISEGKTSAFIGSSGVGKSTLALLWQSAKRKWNAMMTHQNQWEKVSSKSRRILYYESFLHRGIKRSNETWRRVLCFQIFVPIIKI